MFYLALSCGSNVAVIFFFFFNLIFANDEREYKKFYQPLKFKRKSFENTAIISDFMKTFPIVYFKSTSNMHNIH